MKQTINASQFSDAFLRADHKENFSYAGLDSLFGYLESMEEDTGEEMELDIIALCCEFAEYSSMKEVREAYSTDIDEAQDEETKDKETLEWLRDQTTVIEIENGQGVIIAQF